MFMLFYQMRNLRPRIHPMKSEVNLSRCKRKMEAQTTRRQRLDPHHRLQQLTTTGLPSSNNHRHLQGTALYHKVTQTDITVYNTVTTGRCRSLCFSLATTLLCVHLHTTHMTHVFLFFSLTLKVSESQKNSSLTLRCRWLQYG